MDCQAIQQWLDAYADGRVPPQQARDISQHLGFCAQCRRRFDQWRALSAALEDLPVDAPPYDLTRSTLQAYRTRLRKSSIRQWWAMLGPGLRAVTCAATAAGFGLGVFLAVAMQEGHSAELPAGRDVYVAAVDPGDGGLP